MTSKKLVFLDLETYSPVSLPDAGVVKYSSHPKFSNVIASIEYDDKNLMIVGNKNIREIVLDLKIKGYYFVAHNAAFEYFALRKLVPKDKWICTAVMSAYFGGASSLEHASEYYGLKLPKLLAGKKLAVDWVSEHKGNELELMKNKENWDKYVEYCERDTKICKRLYEIIIKNYGEVPDREWKYFQDTLTLMDRKIVLDRPLVKKLIKTRDLYQEKFDKDFNNKYGFNPRSYHQTVAWLEKVGSKITKTGKPYINSIKHQLPKDVQDMFTMKHSTCPAILKKFEQMDAPYIHPPIRHFGTMTGRYSSSGTNILNLPKPKYELDLDQSPREIIDEHGMNTPEILKSAMRACIIAPKGGYLFSSDFSLIEFRILMYITKHLKEVLDKDIYLEFAKKLFGKDCTKEGIERKVGKICILGMGYGMNPATLLTHIRSVDPRASYDLAVTAYKTYHRMFPNVRKLYRAIDKKIKNGDRHITLLNGRKLFFPHSRMVTGKLLPANNYGSGFTGNYIQSNARELLFHKQHKFIKAGYYNIFNVYDELVGYVEENDIEPILKIMKAPVSWLPKEVIDATVFIGKRYVEEEPLGEYSGHDCDHCGEAIKNDNWEPGEAGENYHIKCFKEEL